jgi:hypothetical protein
LGVFKDIRTACLRATKRPYFGQLALTINFVIRSAVHSQKEKETMAAAIKGGGEAPMAQLPIEAELDDKEKAGWAKVVLVVLETLGKIVKELADKQQIDAVDTVGRHFYSNLTLTGGGHRPRFKEIEFKKRHICYFEYASSLGHGCQIDVVSPFTWTSQLHSTGITGSAKQARKDCEKELLQKLTQETPGEAAAGPDPTRSKIETIRRDFTDYKDRHYGVTTHPDVAALFNRVFQTNAQLSDIESAIRNYRSNHQTKWGKHHHALGALIKRWT